MQFKRGVILFLFAGVVTGLIGCTAQATLPVTTPSPVEPSPSAPPPAPSATLAPMAVMVNQEGILLSDYQAEVLRFQTAEKAAGAASSEAEARERVLDELVNQLLLAQGAEENGFTIDDADIQSRIAALAEQAGGAEKLSVWQARNGYDADSFTRALRVAIAADWQREQITAALPDAMEQVHARQIFTVDKTIADQLYQQLQSGLDFATIAKKYDPLTGGDLGWFTAGVLFQPEVEEAAFALTVGEYSPVIETEIGYHIVQLIDKGVRPLNAEAHQKFARQAIETWLAQRRSESQIESLLP